MPRRIPDYPTSFAEWNLISSYGTAITLASTILFIYIIFDAFVNTTVSKKKSFYKKIYFFKSSENKKKSVINESTAFIIFPICSFVLMGFVTRVVDGIPFLYTPSQSWQISFQEPATIIMRAIIELHNDIMFFLIVVVGFVLIVLLYIVYYFKESNTSSLRSKITHNTLLEVVWTVIPSLILIIIALPSFVLLYTMDELLDPQLTLKITGRQWYWSYEITDANVGGKDLTENPFSFDSYMVASEDNSLASLRLLEVDNPLLIPINTSIRVFVTSSDVLHSWAVPSLGIKVDSCPGRINQVALNIYRRGIFFGQCSELCGINHGFMPIVVIGVELPTFLNWVLASSANINMSFILSNPQNLTLPSITPEKKNGKIHNYPTSIEKNQSRLSNKFILNILHNHIIDYPTPKNLNYFYNFGSIAGIILVIQIITGILLAMHYTPNTALAFLSVEHIMRDVNMGWFLRYAHANGASMFFLIVYLHIARGIFYSSYKTSLGLWISGVIIFILMMATAFIGYVLPWGQMSFWGATVITNLFTAIPGVGPHIAFWLWGGFAVDNATLNRFFSLHYLVPFIIAAVSIIHLIFLHMNGSTNPLVGTGKIDKISFHPYFTLKDIFGFLIFCVLFSVIIFWYPNTLGHPDNYIFANPLVTPLHIVPEWYFLPFYAILRACPNKIGGIVLMGGAIAILLVLPFLNFSRTSSILVNPIFKIFTYLFFASFLLLGWLGAQPVEQPFIIISQICSFCYFLYFVLVFITNIVCFYIEK